MSEKRIAWLGLGLIGLPMAARLAAAGWDVKGFDIDAERLSLAVKRGISPAAGRTDAIAGARFVFTSLPKETVLIELAERLGLTMPFTALAHDQMPAVWGLDL